MKKALIDGNDIRILDFNRVKDNPNLYFLPDVSDKAEMVNINSLMNKEVKHERK